jgi:hypothetical protein
MKKILVTSCALALLSASAQAAVTVTSGSPGVIVQPAPVATPVYYAPPPTVYVTPRPAYYMGEYERHRNYDWSYWQQRRWVDRHWEGNHWTEGHWEYY